MKLYLRLFAAAYIASSLYIGLSDNADLWGVYHLSFLPDWVDSGLFILSLFLLLSPQPLLELAERLADRASGKPAIAAMAAIALISSLLFVVFRSKNHLLGDGYQVLSNITDPSIIVPTEILDILGHRFLHYLVGSPELSYLLLSVLAGLMFLVVIWMYARSCTDDTVGRIAVFTMFLGLAQMQFFFGYVENYTLMSVLAALFLYLGWQDAAGNSRLLAASLIFLLAGLFHASAYSLLPGLLYLYWRRGKRENRPLYVSMGFSVFLLAFATAAVYYTEYQGEQIFVPIFATALNPYSLLSFSHLFDLINVLLLVAPLPAIVLLASLTQRRVRRLFGDPQALFLSLSTLGAALFTVGVDPKLGALRDWDLLALFGIPLAFLAIHISVRRISNGGTRKVLAGAGLAIILLHTIPWILSNTAPIPAKDMMIQVVRSDPHYSPDYYKGYRLISWSNLVGNEPYSDFREVVRACSLRVAGDPNDSARWVLYARASYFLGRAKQAYDALGEVNPGALSARWIADYVRLLLRFGELKEAEKILSYAIEAYPDHKPLVYYFNIVSRLEDNPEGAMQLYESTLQLAPNLVGLLNDGVTFAMCIGDYQAASEYLRRAAGQPDLSPEEWADIYALGQILMQRLNSQP